MEFRKPIVRDNGSLNELQSGDSLDSNSVSDQQIVLPIKEEGSLVKNYTKSIEFGSGSIVSDLGSNEVEVEISDGGAETFSPVFPNIQALNKTVVTSSNTGDYSIGSSSNKFLLNIDECGDVEVTLTQGTRTAQQICDDINTAIRNSSNSDFYNDSYSYAYVDSNKVCLRSIKFALYPTVQIKTITNDAYTVLGFSVDSYEAVDQEKINIDSLNLLLPDGSELSKNQSEIDITSDSVLEQQEIIASAGQKSFDFSNMNLITSKARDIIKPDFHINLNNNYIDWAGDNEIDSVNNISFTNSIKYSGSHSVSMNGTNSYLNYGNILNFERDDEFSFACSVRFNNTTSNHTIIGKRYASSTYRGYLLAFEQSTNKIIVILASDISSGNYIHVRSSTTITANQFYRIVVSYDGSSNASGITMWINGVQQTLSVPKNSLSGTILNDLDFYIGTTNNSSNYLGGYVSDVSIYSKELSSIEANNIYRNINIEKHGLYANNNILSLLFQDNVDDSSKLENSVSGSNITYGGGLDKYAIFNGSSSGISLGNNSDFLFERNDELSFSYWCYSQDETSNDREIFNSTGSSGTGIRVFHNNDKIYVRLINTWSSNCISVYTSQVLDLNQWNHIMIVYDGSSDASGIKIYVDKIEQTLTTEYDNLSSTIVDSGNSVYIGYNDSGNYYYGYLYSFEIFNEKINYNTINTLNNDGVRKKYDYINYDPSEIVLHLNNTNKDYSFNKLSGQNTDITFSSTTKKLGSHSAGFNGFTSKIDYGNVLNFERDEPFSVEAWCYHTSTTANPIASTRLNDSTRKGWFFYISNLDYLSFQLINTTTTNNRIYVYSSSALSKNQWNHVIVTYDGSGNASGINLYINGSKQTITVGNDNLTSTIVDSGQKLMIGYDRDTNSSFNGNIDELVVFSKELIQSEIDDRYNSGSGVEYIPESEDIPNFKIKINGTQKEYLSDYYIGVLNEIVFYDGLNVDDEVEAILKIITDNWHYLYTTDISLFSSSKIFVSNQAPNWFGEHKKSAFNARFIGSFYAEASNKVRSMLKIDDEVIFNSVNIYSATLSTSNIDLSLQDYIPPTTNVAKLYCHSSNSSTICVLTSKYDNDNQGTPHFKNDIDNYKNQYLLTDKDRNISIRRELSDYAVSIYIQSYLENVQSPMEYYEWQ